MPQRHPADTQELQDFYHSPAFEKIKKSWFSENNIEKKQPDFNNQLIIDDKSQAFELGRRIKEERALSIKREAAVNELCKLLGVDPVEELLSLVKSGKIGYMPKDGKPWYEQFDNKKHKKRRK